MNVSAPPAAGPAEGRAEGALGAAPKGKAPASPASSRRLPSRAKSACSSARCPADALEQRILQVKEGLERGQSPDGVLGAALRLVAEHWGARSPLILTAASNRQHLLVRFGLRDDIEGLRRELKFSLRHQRRAHGAVRSAYNSGKDCLIKDCFDKENAEVLPPAYYEVLGSPALAIYACLGKGVTPALMLVEADHAQRAPPTRARRRARRAPAPHRESCRALLTAAVTRAGATGATGTAAGTTAASAAGATASAAGATGSAAGCAGVSRTLSVSREPSSLKFNGS